jgi:hypothetical protein
VKRPESLELCRKLSGLFTCAQCTILIAIANDITATQRSAGACIPIEGPFSNEEGSCSRGLYTKRDLIASVVISWLHQVLQDQTRHIHSVPTMGMHHNTARYIDTTIPIDYSDRECLISVGWVLHSKPFVVALIVVSFSESIGSETERTRLTNDICSTCCSDLEAIAQ